MAALMWGQLEGGAFYLQIPLFAGLLFIWGPCVSSSVLRTLRERQDKQHQTVCSISNLGRARHLRIGKHVLQAIRRVLKADAFLLLPLF